jgi:hypothetical protein
LRYGTTDILVAGNFYGVLPYEGSYDAGYGTVMLNEGNSGFKMPNPLQTGIMLDGEVKDIKVIKAIQGKKMIAVARNDNIIKIFSLKSKTVEKRK